MKLEEKLKILVDARELINKPQKWCKYRYTTGSRHCAVGAITCAMYPENHTLSFDDPRFLPIMSMLNEEAGNALPNLNIMGFNDHPKTRHKDVMKLLDKVIKDVRRKIKASK